MAAVTPARPARGVAQGLGDGGAEFVDRGIVAEFRVLLEALEHGLGEGVVEFLVMRGRSLEIFRMIVGILARGEVL